MKSENPSKNKMYRNVYFKFILIQVVCAIAVSICISLAISLSGLSAPIKVKCDCGEDGMKEPTTDTSSDLPKGPDIHLQMDSIKDSLLEGSVTGEVYGGASLVAGKKNQALYLNGNNQYVDLGNHRRRCFGNLELCPNGITIALWLKFGTNSDLTQQYIFSNGGQTVSSYGVALYKYKSYIAYSLKTTKWEWGNDQGYQVSNTKWYHVTLTWTNKEQGVKLFINGNLETDTIPHSVASSTPSTSFNNVYLGKPNTLDGSNSMYDGNVYIDDMQIFYAELSETEVLAIFNKYN